MMPNFLMLMKLHRNMKFLIMPSWKRRTLKVMSLRMMMLVRVRVKTVKTLKKVMKMPLMTTF